MSISVKHIGETKVQKLINDDTTLNKDSFNKVVRDLDSNLKKILVPSSRSFLNFHFPEGKKPVFKDYADSVESDEALFPSLDLYMKADSRINHIPSLYDQWFEANGNQHHRSGQTLMDQPSATNFTVQLAKKVEEILGNTTAFKKNKWRPAAMVEIKFANHDTVHASEYTDFLDICLSISIIQG